MKTPLRDRLGLRHGLDVKQWYIISKRKGENENVFTLLYLCSFPDVEVEHYRNVVKCLEVINSLLVIVDNTVFAALRVGHTAHVVYCSECVLPPY